MRVDRLSKKGLKHLKDGLKLIEEMKKNEDYFECIKTIMGLMEFFKEDEEFYNSLYNLRDSTKNLWKNKLYTK
jgi:hypothetical protein